jgi:hypothetical protein
LAHKEMGISEGEAMRPRTNPDAHTQGFKYLIDSPRLVAGI